MAIRTVAIRKIVLSISSLETLSEACLLAHLYRPRPCWSVASYRKCSEVLLKFYEEDEYFRQT